MYTRLKSQNMRNIWGRFFPGFVEKENRLYNLVQIGEWSDKLEALRLEAIHFFKFNRALPLKQILSQAEKKHYSTFSLYTEVEFDKALKRFKENIKRNFEDIKRVQWSDENVMILFRKN